MDLSICYKECLYNSQNFPEMLAPIGILALQGILLEVHELYKFAILLLSSFFIPRTV